MAAERQVRAPGELEMCIMESEGAGAEAGRGDDDNNNNYVDSRPDRGYLPGRKSGDRCSGEAAGIDNRPDSSYFMPGRLRSRARVWERVGASRMVMGWILTGFMAWFHTECPYMSRANQESCYEPLEHHKFIEESMEKLLVRGVIGKWEEGWGRPRVISRGA